MTRSEKIVGIRERIKTKLPDEIEIPVADYDLFAIVSYGMVLEKHKLFERNQEMDEYISKFPAKDLHDYVRSVIEEFEWKPTNQAIADYVSSLGLDSEFAQAYYGLLVFVRDSSEEEIIQLIKSSE
jgi:hypothetical protein